MVVVIYSIFAFLISISFASFCNVLIYRIPRGISLLRARSKCPHCGAVVPAIHNIPLLSYLLLQGKSKCCSKPISARYLAVEILVTVFSLPFIWKFVYLETDFIRFFFYLVFITIAVALAFIDSEQKLLPFELSYPALILALIFSNLYGDLSISLIAVGLCFFALDALVHFANIFYYGKERSTYCPGALCFNINFLAKHCTWIYIAIIISLLVFNSEASSILKVLAILYLSFELVIDPLLSKKNDSATDEENTVLGGGDIAMLAFISALMPLHASLVLLLAATATLIAAIGNKILDPKKQLRGSKIPFGLALAVSMITVMIVMHALSWV